MWCKILRPVDELRATWIAHVGQLNTLLQIGNPEVSAVPARSHASPLGEEVARILGERGSKLSSILAPLP